ncbi:Uma2 family endonuclease [Streptomyces sp. NPDC058291]|uniref:Uma2 family endonuclease n=1 Tax=Streptomyces sp. NPDC058291 TaxID=3346427 RepID=UPI0036ED61BA
MRPSSSTSGWWNSWAWNPRSTTPRRSPRGTTSRSPRTCQHPTPRGARPHPWTDASRGLSARGRLEGPSRPHVGLEDARKEGKRSSFEDVLLISEVVSISSAREDHDDCTAKYGRYGIPIYLVEDPYAQEVVLHTQPTAAGHIAAPTHKYGTGKLLVPLADGRTFTLDLDEPPRPEPDGDTR